MNVESKRWMTLVGELYNRRAEYFSVKWEQLKKDKALNADLVVWRRRCSSQRSKH